jgi:hypothetical protein
LATVREWVDRYPRAVEGFRDADGRPPQHTFFYPQEEYDAGCVEGLAELVRGGYGEVEIHLHHRNDTAEGLRAKLEGFRDCLRERHGLLGHDAAGRVRYGFVHGNWALCNSRPDGDWCGVNEELAILAATGCYADFSFPSAPSPTQPRTVNTIYYARDRRGRPRGCDRGRPVRVSPREGDPWGAPSPARGPRLPAGPSGDAAQEEMMLIPGPLALDWGRRKWGLLPRLENAELSAANPPRPGRMELWVRQAIGVRGLPDWIFVKLHTHGAVRANSDLMLGDGMRRAHAVLRERYNDGRAWRLHYVTARELYNLARAAEAGRSGDPGAWRDFELRPPHARGLFR